MEYKGDLYGKVGGGYFPLMATTEDVNDLKNMLIESAKVIGMLRRSITAHPDCEEGSEFDDFSTTAQEQEDKIYEFLNTKKF